MADIDAADILMQNIIAVGKCPTHHRNLWRQAIAEVNHAGQSPEPQICKGAEVTLALLPNMLLRAPSALERCMSTRHKMDLRFARLPRNQVVHSDLRTRRFADTQKPSQRAEHV